jgi:hypothetical protein
MSATKYRALVGLDYPPGKRAEPGDVVSDLPDGSVKWLIKQNLIEFVGEQPASDKHKGGGGK